MESRLFLGVDGGASNITAVVVNAAGKTLYEKKLPRGGNYHALGLETAVEHLETAMQDVTDALATPRLTFARAVFGLAGCNFASDKKLLTKALRQSSISTLLGGGFEVVNDSRIALRAGTEDGIGLVLIAGTGSNCYGRATDDKEAKAGGVDHILSDEGSGYDIGLRGLRAVVEQLDGRGDETTITPELFAKLEVASLEELYREVYSHYTVKPQIASLAEVVCDCASQGDVVAMDILNHSVNKLIELVDAVVTRLDWRETRVPAVVVGSIIHHPYVSQRLETELHRVAPMIKVVRPSVSSAMGAALMALDEERTDRKS